MVLCLAHLTLQRLQELLLDYFHTTRVAPERCSSPEVQGLAMQQGKK